MTIARTIDGAGGVPGLNDGKALGQKDRPGLKAFMYEVAVRESRSVPDINRNNLERDGELREVRQTRMA